VVCSDGVTISTAIPSVKDVVVKDIKTVPRLIEDNNSQVWLLDLNFLLHNNFSDITASHLIKFPITVASSSKII
jgi:hypothetical protein